MVRLMLVLAPVSCVVAAIGISSTLKTYTRYLKEEEAKPKVKRLFSKELGNKLYQQETGSKTTKAQQGVGIQKEIALVAVFSIATLLVFYTYHCTWVTSEAYSSPSIVLAARGHDGNKIIFDDFREAYYWLRQNTAPDARVMSWWDYGYQITAMANRTVLVDNNTWNNSHIALVGKAFASSEENAYKIMRELDVDYVLVIFGGLIGYASDDINKFLWMVRIAGSTDPNIREADYFTPQGEFRVDREGSPIMLNSLMYKCCYYGYGTIMTEQGNPYSTSWNNNL